MTTESIYNAIRSEHERQNIEWGGPDHDDLHSPNDWISFIVKQLGKANPQNLADWQGRMIKIAALAIAALESAERCVKK